MECPICSKKFPANEISRHVDLCLDGEAEPAPMTLEKPLSNPAPSIDLTEPERPSSPLPSHPHPYNPESTLDWPPMSSASSDEPVLLTGTPPAYNPQTTPTILAPSTPPHSPLPTPTPISTQPVAPTPTVPMETAATDGASDEEAELARLQMEAFLYWQKRREQEEEDMRLARQLQSEAGKSPVPSPVQNPTPVPSSPITKPTPVPTPTPSSPIPTPTQPVPTTIAVTTPAESDSDVVRRIIEEEARKAREAEEADRRIAEELWRKEKEEEEAARRKREMDEALRIARLQGKTESDEELARLLKEKEDLRAELERLRSQELTAIETGDTHVAVNLQGVEYPERWQKQRSDFQSFDVIEGTDEYHEVSTHFHNTVGSTLTITRIERNQNRTLWTWYYLRRQQVALKNRRDPNEKLLFHGSRANAYDAILKDGFDHRVANMGGAIGAGIYFATHASTSTGYVTGGHVKKMLYCRVTLGSVGVGKSGIRRPPDRRGGGIHDSVGQVHSGNGMYVVFDNSQAYPEYVIHYK